MKKLKIETVKMIDEQEFSDFVSEVYGRPYCYQQQNGCQPRGLELVFVDQNENVDEYIQDYDYKNDSIPIEVNGDQMGVSFKSWLSRDPSDMSEATDPWAKEHGHELFWHRNFYPNIQVVLQDLYSKGLIEAGKYYINIDW